MNLNSALVKRASDATRYAVHLEFTDGNYDVIAWAYSQDQAIGLALIDARRMKTSDNFGGKLLASQAVPAPEAMAA